MKRLLRNILLIICFSLITKAQTLERFVIASDGNFFSNTFGSLSWTLGELTIETLSAPNNILTQGFQQSDTATYVGIKVNNLFRDLLIWPIPAKDFICAKISNCNFEIKIFDLEGRQLIEFKNCFENIKVDLFLIKTGVYIINITDIEKTINQNIKFSKIE